MNKKTMRIVMISLILILGIASFTFYYLQRQQAPIPQKVMINTINQPTVGSANAKLHIVVFEDLKCMNCMRFNTLLLPKIIKKYVDTGKAKYTVINVAFIPGSEPAAVAARCLYAQKPQYFFDFVKYVFAHQPSEDQNWATIPTLMEFASNVKGADLQTLSQCIANNKYSNVVKNNFKIAAKVMAGTVATPSMYVNGLIVKPLSMRRLDYLAKSLGS